MTECGNISIEQERDLYYKFMKMYKSERAELIDCVKEVYDLLDDRTNTSYAMNVIEETLNKIGETIY